jgi:hypothetical protein
MSRPRRIRSSICVDGRRSPDSILDTADKDILAARENAPWLAKPRSCRAFANRRPASSRCLIIDTWSQDARTANRVSSFFLTVGQACRNVMAVDAIETIITETLSVSGSSVADAHSKHRGADVRCMATAVAHKTGLAPARQVAARFSNSKSAVRRNLARHKWRMSWRNYRINFRLACDAVLIRCKGIQV